MLILSYPAIDIVQLRLPGSACADLVIPESIFNNQVDKAGLRLGIHLHIHPIVVRMQFLFERIKNVCQGQLGRHLTCPQLFGDTGVRRIVWLLVKDPRDY